MKGDIINVEVHHKKAASAIIAHLIQAIKNKGRIYTITVGGESGSGKSEISLALSNELNKFGIKNVILGQDDYFFLPPASNSEKRHTDPDWLGPHIEVNLDLLEKNIIDAIQGKSIIEKPLVDYNANTIETQTLNLMDVKVVIAEGTYTSLLRNIDSKIFITRNWLTTLEDRKKRNRGKEASDPFIEKILATEHKIIAGHRYLADFIINDQFKVTIVEPERMNEY